jgi:subtilisin family serine protease
VVVVTLEAPSLARANAQSRLLSAAVKARRLDLRSPTSLGYLRSLAAEQAAVARRIGAAITTAQVRWRYRIVLNGLAVVLPASQLSRLASVAGVTRVWPSVRYRPLLDRSPHLIHADELWGAPAFTTAGNGIKIGVIDDGVDQTHPFFDARGYAMPPGFPKGNAAFTTAKVIAARAFAPATTSWRYAGLPFDPQESEHATHVAGIAAGNPGVAAVGRTLTGVAPRAYIGNYKVLTVPTETFGLNGNSPEIAAGIEAAVADGMDVINLSLGEPEIEPSRDLVVAAIDAAADAGVVASIAAGNDFQDFGRGSVSSPGSASKAITAAAATKSDTIASFSSSGPTPISLQMKPDVTAPGADIVSSVPRRAGSWASFSGTSMAAPHVAGAVALLLQRHPTWTPADLKSALVTTAVPVHPDVGSTEAVTTREGGGLIDVAAANAPLLFARPSSISFGLMRAGTPVVRSVVLADAGGGAGTWNVAIVLQAPAPGVLVTAPTVATVPGGIDLSVSIDAAAAEREVTGFFVLTRAADTRRIPFWFRVVAPKLDREPRGTLARTGTYNGQTQGRPSLVTTYRYPDEPQGVGLSGTLAGPEQVFRVTLTRAVANFGVAVLSQRPGVRVSPRVVYAGNENRQTGIPALPLAINPYLFTFGTAEPVSGAIRPVPGAYDIVFDSTDSATAGAFTFRFWIDDVTPPTARLLTPRARAGTQLQIAVADAAGSGVDPHTIKATVDGIDITSAYSRARGRVTIRLRSVARGRHRLVLRVSDYQEAKNMENVPTILPNTRVLRASFVVT